MSASTEPNTYLSGYVMVNDRIADGPLCGGNVELFCDDRKAVIRVGIDRDGAQPAWQEWVTVTPEHMQMMRTLVAMMQQG